MKLTGRLKLIAELVPESTVIADVGTDHGYIPIFCIESGKCPRAVAMDVNRQPLMRAEQNIRFHGLADKICTRLSDGLDALCPGEADAIVIAGMGGLLIADITERGKDIILPGTTLILQPMNAQRELREYLYKNGFEIEREYLCREEDKFYVVMSARPGECNFTKKDLIIGKSLDITSPDVYPDYLDYKIGVYEKIISGLCKSRDSSPEDIYRIKTELKICTDERDAL